MVRLVREHEGEYPSHWAAITPIAAKCAMTAETLRYWVRAAEVDIPWDRPDHSVWRSRGITVNSGRGP